MKFLNVMILSLITSVLALAADRSVYFADTPSQGFCASDDVSFDYIDSQGQLCSDWCASSIHFLAVDQTHLIFKDL